ncbi:hypothetical protein PCANC_28940 [Puccinia coronata f. sp. avenae]|uniref:hAT-like transposase RNase-H fold domain-containing protein n=1 Tax=Puccinia coronata f. sp. avenae TaxID=200324 RepID=A0A2N5RU62_9BASI|nr:hypothetical protein PCANC_28940 [Puccinia coronata f. sp. avenae]
MHQDGSAQSKKKSHGCPKQDKAKAQGVKLPLTVSKRNLEQAQGGGNSKETTTNGFLQNLDTKFTLIHDVWTTKGNQFTFIAAAVAYINLNWEYTVCHLTLKMIPWKHLGHLLAHPIATLLNKNQLHTKMLAQTTDLGSNNNTMASKMAFLLKKDSSADSWNPASMHIKCFCHKLALIVNAGLAALSLKTLPPAKTKESVLGFFPVLGKVLEEEKEQTANLELACETKKQNNSTITCDDSLDVDEASESKYDNANDKLSDYASETQPGEDANDDKAIVQKQSTSHSKNTSLQDLTNKLDFNCDQNNNSISSTAGQLQSHSQEVEFQSFAVDFWIQYQVEH